MKEPQRARLLAGAGPAPGTPVALSARQRGAALLVKRGFDVAAACVLLVLLAPLFAVVAVAIHLDSPGPVIFRQWRIGRGGRAFTIVKFRSTTTGPGPERAEDGVATLLNADGSGHGPGPDGFLQVIPEARVTRVGRVLRRTRLDQLPQLVNVVRGQMSLVGPRPDVPFAAEVYQQSHWRRFEVLPGITGHSQPGRSSLSARERLDRDVDYVDRWSLGLDARLLLKSVVDACDPRAPLERRARPRGRVSVLDERESA